MTTDEMIEALADKEHDSWSRWMKYLFSKSAGPTPDMGLGKTKAGSVIIPPELVERWTRQMMTAYADLPESEKQADRDEVERILPIIRKWGDQGERGADGT